MCLEKNHNASRPPPPEHPTQGGEMSKFIPLILNVRLVDAPAGATQEEGYTGFLRLPSAMLALIFLARRTQLFLSLVDRKVEF